MLHVDLHILHAHETVSRKPTSYVANVKKIKFCAKESLFAEFFLIFLHSPQEMPVFYEIVDAPT
jgi:hypothetical protein